MAPAALEQLRSHDDVLALSREKAVARLADVLPPAEVDRILGGAQGLRQVPDGAARRAALLEGLRLKAGPDGGGAAKGARALEELVAYARAQSVPALPASPVFVNRLLAFVRQRAAAAGRGSANGDSVPGSIRSGLVFLRDHLGMDIAVGDAVAEAGAPAGRLGDR